MKIVVTGGAGFIGSHLVELLIQEGHEVWVLDNFSSGTLDNLQSVAGRYQLIAADVRDPHVQSYVKGIDVIFHLAGIADVQRSVLHPRDYYDVNVTGTVNIMEAVKENPGCKVVYAASASCYGNPHQLPTPPHEPTDPLYPYALTKYLGEQVVLHWARVFSIPVTSLRLFNVYGPRLRAEGAYPSVLSVFLRQRKQQQPLTIVGDGKQTRDFVHVEDVAKAFLMAAQAQNRHGVYNVGSGIEHSILELASYFEWHTQHLPPRQGEPHRSCACIRATQQYLGWNPTISLESGVKRLLQEI